MEMQTTPPRARLVTEIIDLIIESVNLRHIDRTKLSAETSLMADGLGLDSVDILEVVVAVEHKFGVKIKDVNIGREVFRSVGSIADYVHSPQ